MRLFVYAEGVSEEFFVNRQLRPHLRLHGWNNVIPIGAATSLDPQGQRGGLSNWPAVESDLRALFLQHPGPEFVFTTLWDYYRTPDAFPGIISARAAGDGADLGAIVEAALAAHFQEARFIPYVQMHEFEALVLASLEGLKRLYPMHQPGIEALQATCQLVGNCEAINDGPQTHPAQRIDEVIPGFLQRKEDDGPIAMREVGLETIRAACPRFHHWLERLEALPAPP
jgi:hypothetical protein